MDKEYVWVIQREDGKFLKMTNGKYYFTKHIKNAIIATNKKETNYWLLNSIFCTNYNCKPVKVEIKVWKNESICR